MNIFITLVYVIIIIIIIKICRVSDSCVNNLNDNSTCDIKNIFLPLNKIIK